jgi:nitroreductase
VLVQDLETRRRLRDLYLEGWYPYVALASAGLTPWGALADRAAEARALAQAPAIAEQSAAGPGGFAEHLDEAPVVLALFADLECLATVDRDLPRYGLVGGASIYPFAWNLLLAARAEGLGGVITTIATRREDDVKALLGAPDEMALAAVIALGHPIRRPRRLARAPVADWAVVDRFGGAPFGA